jgi:hypothetical protein
LNAYRLDVYYPDGTQQSFDVNEPGNDSALIISTPDENTVVVSSVDYEDSTNDFDVLASA